MSLDDRPMTSLQAVILATGPFVFLWSTLRGYVERHGPLSLSLARHTTRLNNQLYAVFSLGLAGLILNDMLPSGGTKRIETFGLSSSDLAYVYHLSKFYEYVDVFNLVAAGHPIGPHMAFHHLTMPFLTFFRVLHATTWEVFALLNCLHHFFMYAYFGGVFWFRRVLPVTGWLQLAAGIGIDVYYLVTNGREAPEAFNRAVSVLLLTRYALLFYEELKSGSQQKNKKTE